MVAGSRMVSRLRLFPLDVNDPQLTFDWFVLRSLILRHVPFGLQVMERGGLSVTEGDACTTVVAGGVGD